jgi:hypothetical protein
MYVESTPVTVWGGQPHPVGFHFGTIAQLKQLPGITVGGLDPKTDQDEIYGMGGQKTGSQPVEIAANTGNPQQERDLVHLGVAIARSGNGLPQFGQGDIPFEALNMFANLYRVLLLGLPQEGPSIIPDEKLAQLKQRFSSVRTARIVQRGSEWCVESEKGKNLGCGPSKEWAEKRLGEVEYFKHKKGSPRGPVSGEMNEAVLSKWAVVALGELQQPGGVGATQDQYNPVLDGENPLDPPNADNSENSHEQAVALETWVNYAVDLLNRGEQDEAILAKLAHDGCPNPKDVLQRAKEQPVEEAPITDEIGQDPFEAPEPDDGLGSGQMESLSQQPPVVASRVRIANSSMTGKVIDRWEGQWGEGFVMVALDEGGTINVSPDAVEIIEPEEEPVHPVSRIQQYIDGLPPVEPTRPQVEARIAAMEAVRRACRANISKVGFHDQVKLASMDSDAQAEIRQLREFLGAIANESDAAYLSGQQRYRPHGIALPGVEPVTTSNREFDRRIAENAAIFAAELPAEVAADAEAAAYAAAVYAASRNGNVAEFVRLAEEHRVVRTEEFAPTEAAEETTDTEGPAEGLYL